nr:MAG TPA: hypothetical protein [Caudoviricetes sp.]
MFKQPFTIQIPLLIYAHNNVLTVYEISLRAFILIRSNKEQYTISLCAR